MKRLGFILFLIALASLTTTAYHLFNQNWIIFRKAETRFSKKEFEAAIPYYEKLLPRDFQVSKVLRHLGSAYLATGRDLKARKIFEKMASRHEGRPEALKELAAIYVSLGRFQDAASTYQAILQEEPDNHSIRTRLARVLLWAGRPEEAINEYRKALGEQQ